MPMLTLRDGQTMFYRDMGRGPAIFLLHGFGMHSIHWLPFAVPLSRKFRVIVPDFRGFGGSHLSRHNQHCVLNNYAEDLFDLSQHLSLSDFKLAGISMGAFIALQFLHRFPDSPVTHYLHIDQGPRGLNNNEWHWGLFGEEHHERMDRARHLIDALDPHLSPQTPYDALPATLRRQLWRDLGDFFASALSRPSHKRLARMICRQERLVRKIMPVENWSAYISCLRAYIERDYDMRETLQSLRVPLTLLVGLKSEMYPCGGQLRIADYVDDCELKLFENSGHSPLVDQPLKFFQTLYQFADKT